MNPQAYTLLGLTAIVAGLVAVVVFAALRFIAAARDSRAPSRSGSESPFMAIAVQEAIQKLRSKERQMAERAEASERLSTQIVDNLSAGLLVVDRAGQVRILNPVGRRMLGLDAATEWPHYSSLPAAAAPLAGVIEECLRTGQPIVRRALEMPAAAPVTHVGVTVSPLGPDAAAGVICLFSDLTAVVQLEEQLRMKETLARLGELTAGIAHEFRNGLATIHGYGKLIDPAAVPASYKPYVEGIRQETEALGQVVTNFLNFARPTQLSLATHDLSAIIERASDDLRIEAHALNGDIVVTGEFGRVDADDVLLRQAFMNLLRNAIEACQSAGVVPRIRVDGAIESAQRVTRVNVYDNGPGVPPDVRDRIFRPFFTTKKTGTGLGLALVQKIVVTHNGRVAATASPEGGACFQVVLPVV